MTQVYPSVIKYAMHDDNWVCDGGPMAAAETHVALDEEIVGLGELRGGAL